MSDNPQNPHELTPEERAVAAEGLSLEAEVKRIKGEEQKEPGLLGPDGKPLDEKPEGIVTTEDSAEEQMRQAIAVRRKHIEENSKKINEILDKHDTARMASEAVLCAWKLLFFSINDLGTFKGMTNDMLEQVSNSMRAVAMQGGINVHELRHALLGGKKKLKDGRKEFGVVPYLKSRIEYYAAASRKRKAAIKEVQRRIGDKGIALPCHTLREIFKEEPYFTAGRMLVLRGEERAVRMALRHCAFEHQTKNGGEPFYLSSARGQQEWDAAFKIMPLKWWDNAADTDHRLMETFQPVVDSKSVLLVMEGLTHLWAPEEWDAKKPDWERKARALGKLYQWATENLVAVIVGDFVDPGEEVEERTYGGLPHVNVTIGRPGGSDEESLLIGSDVLPLITEE
jgi:hypothetical protein